MKFIWSFFACYSALFSPIAFSQPLDDIAIYTDSKLLISEFEKQPYQNVSTALDTVKLLLDEMNYSREVMLTSLPRAFALMDDGEAACVVNKILNPQRREKYALSLPLNFFQSVRLYQLASLPPLSDGLLNDNHQLRSLHEALTQYPDAAIILPSDFSYGKKLDDDIAQADPEQIIRLPNDVYFERFMQLFFKHKVGFALIFPSTHDRAMQYVSPVPFREYQVEGIEDFTSGHVLCADTQRGREAIAAINDAIVSLYASPAYLQAHLRYLPESSRPVLKEKILSVREAFNN
ncbi:hypothetical protein [Alteromonas antoniana]|uniref:hypothetical protein n=1 Tax=Alteromonas antoniana TaxID=2803813 RepID=UPI001C4858E1|nr:hypothetical protein [Alteromonas antoniana]